MADIRSMVKELIKIGECSSSNFENGTVRVAFPDRQNMVSSDLPVMVFGGWGVTNGLPQPGDTVLCLFLGNGLSNGVCIGVIPNDLPGTSNKQGTFFEDGSYVYYDRSTGQLMIKPVSKVMIEGDLTVSGTITASNIT
ncbi:hypothetical protein [Paenibacillus macquariensis]|uniref:Phage P2 baseplate assembly protein gpV n=1 Tax=Paenibacillus macquariensis TaxID=948756 RepID=A0ABY1K728_9BACL|nr:hypothetical protein [Paenibacillus macquariensis]MEC0092506.1 phage baseplate assembly protein V [Paenibacillus macquariensis]OAB35464.1 hypothetical protein PMSM_09415 [Paenibacillus macquariensis subsp. macquariensis]SIR35255.1 Phage P2 baseplate assembly protein gpV [Paenibacillus macquariensis]